MLHECHYCYQHMEIEAFHECQVGQICIDCYEADIAKEMEQAFILAERDRLKDMMFQIDLEELPF